MELSEKTIGTHRQTHTRTFKNLLVLWNGVGSCTGNILDFNFGGN